MSRQKRAAQALLFLAVMLLTFYAVFHGQDAGAIFAAVRQTSMAGLAGALFLGLFFITAEGFMIWYLLSAMGGKSDVWRCIQYSFIGFFYSGITPSATGGQPVQLYYMKKDGNEMSDCSVVLMTVALAYKLVLVLVGLAVLAVWHGPLKQYFGGYFFLIVLGIFLNTIVVLAIWGLMVYPALLIRLMSGGAWLLERMHLLKKREDRRDQICRFAGSYQRAVDFIRAHRGKLAVVIGVTLLQRCSVFFLTYVVYRGFHLQETGVMTIMALQSAVYLAVDMLPVPGAQGITELVYRSAFEGIFTKSFLIPSMLVSRAMNFYLPLLVSGAAVAVAVIREKTAFREKTAGCGKPV